MLNKQLSKKYVYWIQVISREKHDYSNGNGIEINISRRTGVKGIRKYIFTLILCVNSLH